MTPIDLKEVDEVLLALSEAKAALIFESHTAIEFPGTCMGCYALYLVERGLAAYARRVQGG